jgi:adenylylsulfate kinase-like enzyme
MIVWIIGLSGAGKSTLANEIVAQVRQVQKNVILLDGDMIRDAFNNDLGHTMEDRLANARRICQIGKFLDDQGVNVVCAILSLFPESQLWNRTHLKNYFEIFIDVPMADLLKRDYKGIYRKFQQGEIKNVAGMDIDFPRPKNADLVIENVGSQNMLLTYATEIAQKIIKG